MILDPAKVPIPCPKCGRKTSKAIGWLKTHAQFTCGCGTVIHLKRDQFLGEMRKVDAAVTRFKRSLASFNKR